MSMHIGHVGLRVTNLERAVDRYQQALGLREVSREPGEVRLTASNKHHALQLLEAPVAGLDHVGLEVEGEEALERVCARAAAAGVEVLEPNAREDGLGSTIRLVGPASIVYEIYDGMERDPLAPETHQRAGIRRLGHLTFLAREHEDILRFWLDVLGFRISDQFEGMTWTRCDVDHHGLAVGPRPEGAVLHHTAWEVQDLGALGQYCDDLVQHDLALSWGPVRHGPGFNIATYLPDADGALIEVYTDLLRIHDERSYVPVDWSRTPRALNLWGPAPEPAVFEAGVPPLAPRVATAAGAGPS
jgi:catechol 2,3-dioxygenase